LSPRGGPGPWLRLAAAGASVGAAAGAANWAVTFSGWEFARAYLVALVSLGAAGGAILGVAAAALLAVARRAGLSAPAWPAALRPFARAASHAWILALGLGLAGFAAYIGSAPRFSGFLSDAPRNPESLEALPPNVILVSFDTVRPDHLGAYGYAGARTPAFDALAGSGALFRRCVGSSSWTVPSHAALLTGVAPSHIGPALTGRGSGRQVRMPDSAVTLAEILRDAGYHTAAFIGGATMGRAFGFSQGFDVFNDRLPPSFSGVSEKIFMGRTLRRALNVPPYHLFRSFDGAFTDVSNFLYDEAQHPASDLHVSLMKAAWRFDNDAAEVNHKVYSWLDRRPPRPFFLFVHYFDAHDPYDPPAPFAPDGYDPRLGYIVKNGLVERVLKEKQPLTADESARLRAGYDGEIAFMDHEFGLLLERLEEEGVLSNALLAVTSDHGESFGEHGLVFHGHQLYDHLTRAVLLLTGKGVPAGLAPELPVAGIDLTPTLLDLAGIPGPAGMEGRPLTPLLRGGEMEARPLYSEVFSGKSNFPDMEAFARTRFSVELDGWKLLMEEDGSQRLFDLRGDPGEEEDVAALHPGEAAKLDELLRKYLALVKSGGEDEGIDGEDDALERLKGLGYIQ